MIRIPLIIRLPLLPYKYGTHSLVVQLESEVNIGQFAENRRSLCSEEAVPEINNTHSESITKEYRAVFDIPRSATL